MAIYKIKVRRGTDAERQITVFDEGEPVFTTDTKKLYIGDGVTTGGIPTGLTVIDWDDIDNTPIDPTGAEVGDILAFNGTKFVPTNEPPDMFIHTESVDNLTPNETRVIPITTNHKRFYGVLMEIQDAPTSAEIKIDLWGNSTYTINQYDGLANSTKGFVDPYQQWRFRNFDGDKIIYLQVENRGVATVSFDVYMELEPF